MALADDVASLAAKGDTFFLVWAGCLVFFMQCGFGARARARAAPLRAGASRSPALRTRARGDHARRARRSHA